ncbi:MAG: hypothetical protein ACOCV4_01255 [Myxococcota bacterium]
MRAALALATALGVTACSSGGDDVRGASLASTGSVGVVQIERSGTAARADSSEHRAELNAVFARYRGLEGQDALELLGVGRAGPETDSCALVSPPPVQPDADAIVELLDVGTLEVRVGDSRAHVAPRVFPELGALVAGSFYAKDAELVEARADRDTYRVVATGGEEVEPFEVEVVAPAAPDEVSIGGFAPDERPVLGRDDEIVVVWDAGDPGDRIDLTLAAGSTVIECVARDDGMLQIPADVLSEIDTDPDARLVMRRVRVQPFDAPGLEAAWADLISTRTIAVDVR